MSQGFNKNLSTRIFAKNNEHPLQERRGGLAWDETDFRAVLASLNFSLGSCEGLPLLYIYYPFYTYDL